MDILGAGGIAAVGDDDDDLAARARPQIARRQEDGVVERRTGVAVKRLQPGFQRPVIMGEGMLQGDVVVEAIERHGVLGIALREQGTQEARGGIGLVQQFLVGGAAGIHQQGDGERQLGAALEDRNLLRHTVVEHREIALLESAHQLSGLVPYGGEDAHQVDFGAKHGGLLRAQGGGAEQSERHQAPVATAL